MATLTERAYTPDWLFHDDKCSYYARDKITVLAGSGSARVLTDGMVLGKVVTGAATPAAAAGNTGNGVHGAVTVSAGAKVGVYNSVCIEPGTNVGKFLLSDPDGVVVGVATVAAAFSAGGLAFTIADGSTDFVSGDAFTITVAAGSGKYVAVDLTGANGQAVAAGILIGDTTAPNGSDKVGVALVRGPAIVVKSKLGWGALDANQQTTAMAQLKLLGILEASPA